MKKSMYFLAAALLVVSCKKEEVQPEFDTSYVYFQVADPDVENGESYLLPLNDPAAVAQAREMVANPQLGKIVVAEIEKINNGTINKDLNRKVTYSWKIAAFLGFADFTVEIYDGNPQYVEDHYDEWVQNTKGSNGRGRVGFWGYRIVREVQSSEVIAQN